MEHYDLLNLEIMFLKVVKVDKFLKSSSMPFHNQMDDGIQDLSEILVLLKGSEMFILFLKG